MRTVNMHEAKTHLSRLTAAAGEPLVKVIAVDAPVAGTTRRTTFMEGEIAIPDEFDRIGADEIEAMFGGGA